MAVEYIKKGGGRKIAPETEKIEEMNLSSMLAIAELYETVEKKDLENKMAIAELFEMQIGGVE